jgi:hypothetical protein
MSRPSRLCRFLHISLAAASLTVGGAFLDASQPRPSYSAEAIRITTTGPLAVTISIDSLETFAETGEVTDELKLYARFMNDYLLEQLQTGLTFQFPLDVVMVILDALREFPTQSINIARPALPLPILPFGKPWMA